MKQCPDHMPFAVVERPGLLGAIYRWLGSRKGYYVQVNPNFRSSL